MKKVLGVVLIVFLLALIPLLCGSLLGHIGGAHNLDIDGTARSNDVGARL